MKKLFILINILIIISVSNAFSHAQHYAKIKYLKYNLFLNDELIGYHTFHFKSKNELLFVKGEGYFKVSKLGIDLIKYFTNSDEVYKENQLVEFNSNTKQNDKIKYVKVKLNKNTLNIDGSSFKGETDSTTLTSSWWNHEIVKKKKQISSISGRIIDQKVNFLGKKKINIDKKDYNTLKFHIFSNDNKPMNEKKINIKIWYDLDSLIWLKASYEKLGKWEYQLAEIKY